MTPTSNPPVAGLPIGVELVKFGAATADDYELVNELSGTKIYKGPRVGAASGVIVKPADGYAFRFDIRSLSYFVVKEIPATTIIINAKFVVTNDFDRQSVDVLLGHIKSMPGYIAT